MNMITAITMPRWGLTMEQGTVTSWLSPLDGKAEQGVDIVEVESTKLAGSIEAPASGILRRQIIEEGRTVPIGTLLGVIAEENVSEAEIDEFVGGFAVIEADASADAQITPSTVEVNGQAISYIRMGEGGVPIVFVHGFGGDASSWGFIQETLANEYETIALDLPGHGASSKSVTNGSLEWQAKFLAQFLGAIGVGHAHLVGHSMGGGICIALAAAEPDLVASLTLIAPMGLTDEIDSGYLTSFIEAQKRRDIQDALKMLFADESLANRALAEEVVRYKRMDGVPEALQAIAKGILAEGRQARNLLPEYHGLDLPVALLAGAVDRVIPSAIVKELGGTIIDDVGHMPQVEALDTVIGAIRSVAK